MNDYDKNKESSYLQHCNVNNLYGLAKLSVRYLSVWTTILPEIMKTEKVEKLVANIYMIKLHKLSISEN